MKRFIFQFTGIIFLLISISTHSNHASAEELTLLPGEALEVHFSLPQVPTPGLDYDLIFLGSAGSVTVVSPVSGTAVGFFDGANLLGVYSTGIDNLVLPAIFKTIDSLWDNGQNPTIVDFSSILDGSIDGLFRVTIAGGEVTFDTEKMSLGIRHATGSSSGSFLPADQPIVTSLSIVPDVPTTDTDGDGIPDHVDACPDTFGESTYDGCQTPLTDLDGDRIGNEVDACPNTFGLTGLNGCPARTRTEPSTIDLVVTRVSFSALRDPFPSNRYQFFPTAIVENHGLETAKKFQILFRLDNGQRSSVKVDSLGPGESLFASPTRDSAGRGAYLQPGEYTLQVVSDSTQRISESDESNNVYQLPFVLFGD